MPRELPSRLVRAHHADTGQLHMPPIPIRETTRAGGEPARQPSALSLEPREPDLRAAALPTLGVLPVRQRHREVRQTRGIRLLGILGPPRRGFVLGPVPV